MTIQRTGLIVSRLVLILALADITVAAQGGGVSSQRPAVKAELTRLLHYLEMDGRVAAPELEQLTDLKLKTLAPDATPEQRQAAYKEFFVLLYRLQGNAASQGEIEAQLTGFAQTAASVPATATSSASGWATATTPPGRFGHVEKLGHGPLSLILIPNQEDWSVYKSFMERHAERFTMYAVTLPGYGNTPPPPQPERMDFSQLAWWRNAEEAILNLIAEHKLAKPLLVGTMVGGYLAARVALNHPEQVRGAVLLNALVYAGEAQPLAERLRQAKQGLAAFPSSELMPWSRRPPAEAVRKAIEQSPPALAQIKNWAQDVEIAKQLVVNATANNHPLTARYMNELATTDLTDELKKLRVPLLVIPALPDKDSPYQGKVSLTQFEAVKAQNPALPLTIVPFEDVRSYVLFEAATELGNAIEAFATGKPIAGKRREPVSQNTPLNPKPCSQPVYRQFDFWVGEWNVYSEGKLAGANSVQKILGGCVIQENWTDALGNSGKSFNTYNPYKKKWQQNWVDDRGSVLEFTGEAKDGVMAYQAELPASGGSKLIYRMTFTKLSENRVRQLWEQSTDGGKTWQPLFDGDYQRKT